MIEKLLSFLPAIILPYLILAWLPLLFYLSVITKTASGAMIRLNSRGWWAHILTTVFLSANFTLLLFIITPEHNTVAIVIVSELVAGFDFGFSISIIIFVKLFEHMNYHSEVVFTAPLEKLTPCDKDCPAITYVQYIHWVKHWRIEEQCPFPADKDCQLYIIGEPQSPHYACEEQVVTSWQRFFIKPYYASILYAPKEAIYYDPYSAKVKHDLELSSDLAWSFLEHP